MPDRLECKKHSLPFVDRSLNSKTLHFSICDVQSTMKIGRPDDLVLAYTRLMMGFLLFVPDPRHIAMVGLGGGSLAKFCYRHLPETRIQVVEINPYVIALRNEFEVPADDHRFNVRKADAAEYVRTSLYRYDVILVDGYDANGVPQDLCSQSFYDNCYEMLESNGIFVANLHSSHAHFPAYVDRIRRSFDGHVVTVADLEGGNIIAFACKERLPQALLTNARRCASNFPPETWAQLEPVFSRIRRSAAWYY